MKAFPAFVFLLLYCSVALHAQSVFRGRVIDAGGKKPLGDISVSLLAADSSVVQFSYTDVQGRFEMQVNREIEFLAFSFIGYKRLLMPAAQFRNGMEVALQEDVIRIREVKVTSQRIRRMKDTLTYTVSGFRMPQDRSIEDVLKKIPGIEVAADGTIKFQDKPISHFYIEGMDLLEEKYALGSKNIPASMVKEVQVLQAHQPIAALRGRSFSDNAALNLTLEEKARNRLIKIADIGLGAGRNPKFLWNNRLLGLLFGKKTQNLTMYKNSNMGDDIAAEIVPLAQSGLIDASDGDEEEDFFHSLSSTKSDGIDPERYLFNEAHLIAVNHLYRATPKTDVRLQLSALHSKETAEQESGTIYYYPSQTVALNETERYAGQENRLEGKVTYLLNDSAIYIRNTLQGKIGLHKHGLELAVNGQHIREWMRPKRSFLQNRFELVKNKGNRSFSLCSANTYAELPQSMTITPGSFEELLNGGEAYSCFRQDACLRAFQSNSYTYFQHKLCGFYLKYKAGIRYDNKRLASAVLADAVPVAEADFANDVRLETVKLYVEPSLNFKNNFWSIQAGIPFSLLHSNLKYALPKRARMRERRLLPMPSLSVRHELNAYWSSSFLSSVSYREPDIYRLYAGYLFSSHKWASAYEPRPEYNRNWHNLLGVHFNNPLTGLFFSVNGFYNVSRQETVYGYENTNGYLTLHKAHSWRHNDVLTGVRGRVSKACAWSKLYMAWSTGYMVNKTVIFLEDEATTSSLETLALKFDYSLQPSRYFNISGNSAATRLLSALDYEGHQTAKAWNYRHELDFNFILSPRWKFRVDNTLSHESRNKKLTYFADASVVYSHRLFDVEIKGRNLFNHSQVDNIHVSDFTEQYVIYALRPQELLVKVSFSF